MIVTNLLTLHNQLKIHHWQTKSYAEHQALGGAYDEFSDLIDEFIEVFMGKYGRIESKDGFKIELSNYKEIMLLNLNKSYDATQLVYKDILIVKEEFAVINKIL